VVPQVPERYLVEGPTVVDPQKVAMARIQSKLREDQALKLLAENEKQRLAALKAEKMATKAQELKMKTQERVARYKLEKARLAELDVLRAKTAEQQRLEREAVATNELAKKKLVAMKRESNRR
jgi:hypothetical protein